MDDLQVKLQYKKSDADDWTKVDDLALRKKIQNRLAKRKARKDAGKSRTRSECTLADPPKSKSQTASSHTSGVAFGDTTGSDPTETVPDTLGTMTDPPDDRVQSFMSMPGLSEHRFIRLTQYSFLRALVKNADILALGFDLLFDDDAQSPWTLSHPYPALAPHDLSPSRTQLCTPHHPFLDIVAPPAFRDNALIACSNDDVEERLCYDIHKGSFTVWGSQPWNAMAWEVSQEFATSWWWLLDDALIRATDFWRGERGERPLVLPDVSGYVVEETVS